jgi:hypothetical protein
MSPRTKESRVLDRDPAIQGKPETNVVKAVVFCFNSLRKEMKISGYNSDI